MDNLLKYSIKLAFLNKLYGDKLLSEKEYIVIKNDLMKKHKLVSNDYYISLDIPSEKVI